MIADRQKIRAAVRAADSAGRVNEARQLELLEEGLTTDIKEASPAINKLITEADNFYRTDYAPTFLPKAIPFEASRKPDEAIVQFFFRKAKPGFEKDTILIAESLLRSVKDPGQIRQLGRTLLEGMIERSVDPLTSVFDVSRFAKDEYLAYPNRVREVAFGGRQAKEEIDEIINLIRKQKEQVVLISDLEKGIKGTDTTIEGLAKQIQAGAVGAPSQGQALSPSKELQVAARSVSQTGRTAAAIVRRENEPRILTEQTANYLVRWGALGVLMGGPIGVATDTIPIMGSVAALGSIALAQTLVRPSSRKIIKKFIRLPEGSAAVAPLVARLNTILRETEERKSQTPLPSGLPILRRGEI